MSKLSRIFYIYREASYVVFFLFLALVEFLCYLLIPSGPFVYVALAGTALCTFFALSAALYILRFERKFPR
jgi:hypothetical protein